MLGHSNFSWPPPFFRYKKCPDRAAQDMKKPQPECGQGMKSPLDMEVKGIGASGVYLVAHCLLQEPLENDPQICHLPRDTEIVCRGELHYL